MQKQIITSLARKIKFTDVSVIALFSLFFTQNVFANQENISLSTSLEILPLIKKYQNASISIGVVMNKKIYCLSFGKERRYPINSMTKSFTALLLAYYNQTGLLGLTDKIENHFNPLNKTAIGGATLLNLATHTSGLPLSTPRNITTQQDLIKYLQQWQPPYPVGSRRIYSNTGIGLIGYVLENTTHQTYAEMVNKIILKPYGMQRTEVNPKGIDQFPQGSIYIAADSIVSTARDMAIFMQIMMSIKPNSSAMTKAINTTLTGYYQTPYFTQGLSWQEYAWPISLSRFLKSASDNALDCPAEPIQNVQNNKEMLILRTGTGSHSSSIMAFLPKQKIGVVILTDKTVSTKIRFRLVYFLLRQLEENLNHD